MMPSNRPSGNPPGKPTIQQLLTGLNKSFSAQICLHPNAGKTCSKNIIKAHTIQKNGSLSAIAHKGHVYTTMADQANAVTTGQNSMKLIGIGKASTFTGFCGFHDNATFEQLETKPWTGSIEQCFLVAYRALCRDLYMKRCYRVNLVHLKSMTRGQGMRGMLLAMELSQGIKATDAAMRELDFYKALYDKILLSSDFASLRYYLVNLSATPDVLCTGNFQPEYTISGEFLQDMLNLKELAKHVTFSILATEVGGAIIFAWPDDNEPALKLVQSFHILSDEQIPHAALRLAYEHLENTYASPVWWDNLDATAREVIMKRQLSGPHPEHPRTNSCLVDDGLRAVNWTVASRVTNVTFPEDNLPVQE